MTVDPRKPDFFIVGAAKSGTTSLSNYLAEHPRIAVVSNRLEFFGEYSNPSSSELTLQEYLQLFNPYPRNMAVGEKSVSYLYSKRAAREIASLCPSATIFMILRNPIERAYSDYWHRRRTGVETLSFRDALKVENDRINQAARFELHYVNYGFYSKGVQRYFDLFGKENVHVFLFEELRDTPHEVCRACFEALHLEPNDRSGGFEVHNQGGKGNDAWLLKSLFWMARSSAMVGTIRYFVPDGIRGRITRWMNREIRVRDYPVMETEVKERLRSTFRQEIEQLESLLGRDLSQWLSEDH